MQQPLEDEYLKRKTTNPPKDPAKGSHENSEPPDNPARVTNGQNKKSLEAFITNNFEAFLRGSWRKTCVTDNQHIEFYTNGI